MPLETVQACSWIYYSWWLRIIQIYGYSFTRYFYSWVSFSWETEVLWYFSCFVEVSLGHYNFYGLVVKGHIYLSVNYLWGTSELANFSSHSFADPSFDLWYLSSGCLNLLNFPPSFCCPLRPFLANLILFHFGQKPLESGLLSRPLYLLYSLCHLPVLLFITLVLDTNLSSCERREFCICFAIPMSPFVKFLKNEYKAICYTWRFSSHFVSPLSNVGPFLILWR